MKDENDVSVGLSLPLSLNNAQCERRIYGTRTGFAGMFKTLYSEQRRIESYEAGIRELSMQPEAANNYIDELELVLEKGGVASDDIELVLGLINEGSQSINKKFVKGGNLAANAHNRLAKVGRKLNSIKKNPAFKAACLAMEEIKATKQLTDSVVGAFLLNSLSTDQAWKRLQKIESAMYIARQTGRMVDPALYKALEVFKPIKKHALDKPYKPGRKVCSWLKSKSILRVKEFFQATSAWSIKI